MTLLVAVAISATSVAFTVMAVSLRLEAQARRRERDHGRWERLRSQYIATVKRPAGLDFALWEDELKVRDET